MEASSLKELVEAFVRRFTKHTDFHALYEARVESQSTALDTVDVTPLRSTLKPIQQVPLRLGLPGVKVRLKAGCTVLLGFDAGDNTKPYCALFVAGAELEELRVKTSARVVVDSPIVELAGEGGGASLARVGDLIQCSVTVPGTPPTVQQVSGQILGPGSKVVKG